MRVRAAGGGRRRRDEIAERSRLALVIVAIVAAAGGSLPGAQTPRAISPALYEDLRWQCIGPFDGGPVSTVAGEPGVPGVYTISTPGGGTWQTSDGGGTWTSSVRASVIAGPDPHRWIDPANPRRIARTDAKGIAVSLDGGATWVESHDLPIADVARLDSHERATEPAASRRTIAGASVTVSIVDPLRPGLVFAGTKDRAYVSFDAGTGWSSLQLNMPGVAITDLDIRGNDLIAATQGRSVWRLADISPLRQISATSASTILFRPSDAVTTTADGVAIDYYLDATARGDVRLDVIDAVGRVVSSETSAAPDLTDRWLPIARRLPAGPGHHRVVWNLRFDPPPSPHHRFAQLARALFEDEPPDPDGPRLLTGAYRVKLTVNGHTYAQPLVVRSEAPLESLAAARRRFELSMKTYDAMQAAHRGFLQLVGVRAQLKSLMASSDPDIAAAAADLDARLAVIDGSDWTGLVIPDADDEAQEVDEKEGKHPDFVPPKAVSLSKDYDDPTSVLGRNFANVDHAPAFAILGTRLGEMLTRIDRETGAPDVLAASSYDTSCQQLAGVLDEWRTINAQDLPRLNADLAKRRLPPLPVTASVPAPACPAK